MEKVIDLEQYAATKTQLQVEFTTFIEEVVALNKHLIADNIVKLKGEYEPGFVVETFACQCFAQGLSHKDSQWFLSVIASGDLFEAKSLLVDSFLSDPLIMSVL